MFPNPLQLISRRTPHDYERGFIQAVNIKNPPVRNRRVERILIWGWALIAVKCVAVTWLVHHYVVPFNALWVTAPTVIFGALCTGVYYWRD